MHDQHSGDHHLTRGRTARDFLGDAVFGVAVLGIAAALYGAVAAGGWTIPATVAGLAGTALAALGLIASQAADALRAAGRPRLAPWGFVVTGALIVAAAIAFTELPRTRVGQIPVLAVLAVSSVLCWRLTRPGRAFPAEPPPGGSRPDPVDADAWFARLHALLVGRFDVPAARATALVNEARAHRTATGTAPGGEFPSVAGYARELADAEPARQVPWWRTATSALVVRLAVPVLLLPAVAQAVVDGSRWVAAGGIAVLLWLAGELLQSGRALLRHLRTPASDRR